MCCCDQAVSKFLFPHVSDERWDSQSGVCPACTLLCTHTSDRQMKSLQLYESDACFLSFNICRYCPGGPDSDFEYSTQSYTGYEVFGLQ